MQAKRPILCTSKGQPIATTAVQDVLQCQVHAEVVRRVDVLAHSFKYSLVFQMVDVLLTAAVDDLGGELMLPVYDQSAAGRGCHEPVFHHRVSSITGMALQVKAHEFSGCAYVLRQHPVQGACEDAAGIHPDASVTAQQFQTNPVGAFRMRCTIERSRNFWDVVQHAGFIEYAKTEPLVGALPVVEATLNQRRWRGTVPVGPDNGRNGHGGLGQGS